MAPPRASGTSRGPPPRGPPPRGSQGGVAPEARSSAALSAENMSQIQEMIASALLAERAQQLERRRRVTRTPRRSRQEC